MPSQERYEKTEEENGRCDTISTATRWFETHNVPPPRHRGVYKQNGRTHYNIEGVLKLRGVCERLRASPKKPKGAEFTQHLHKHDKTQFLLFSESVVTCWNVSESQFVGFRGQTLPHRPLLSSSSPLYSSFALLCFSSSRPLLLLLPFPPLLLP
jgi:hypothetical protein